MKVFAILGGLGSQMFKYAFCLAVREETQEKCCIDTSYYLQKKSWNGYELKKVFNIEIDDIVDTLDSETINNIKSNKEDYITAILKFMSKSEHPIYYYFLGYRSTYRNNPINKIVRRITHKVLMFGLGKGIEYRYSERDINNTNTVYFDEYRMNSDELFHKYKEKIQEAFKFPDFSDQRDCIISRDMDNENSVAIHVRRTDHLGDNGRLYNKEYYKKSVEYIKRQTKEELSYYIFSDDIDWCKLNISKLGIQNYEKVVFIDWHSGESSFRDMQLMTHCQYNILAISSFSWWGYYLSTRNDKIVCAPYGEWLEVENHF